jgi:hypothetical protein
MRRSESRVDSAVRDAVPPAERAVGATNQQETQVIERIRSWLKRTALAVMLLLPLAAAAQTSDKPFSNEQLDQMLAQIALYSDSRAVSECRALPEW